MNYIEAMEFLNNSSKFGWKLGLERINKLLEILGNPQVGMKYVHIAGTNGKGSTTAMISSVLKEAGYKTGMFTSPFIQCFEERIQVGGEYIPKEKVCQFMKDIKDAANELDEEYGDVTYFEIVTALGFLYFKDAKIDIGVIEVGLGGRFDATNVIDPILTVITSISFDHTHILGDTIEKIAFEKAGILKEKKPLILYPVVQGAESVIRDRAENLNLEVSKVSEENIIIDEIKKSSGKDKAYQKISLLNHGLQLKLPLVGEHQTKNCAVAVEAILALRESGFNIENEIIQKGIEKVLWPGRMEMIMDSPRFLIDGAHNVDAIRFLKGNLHKYYEYNRLFIMTGMLSDKDIDNMIEIMANEAYEIITTEPHNQRAQGRDELRDMISEYNENVSSFEDYEEGIKYLISKANEDDLILATGSFYLIGEIRSIIERMR